MRGTKTGDVEVCGDGDLWKLLYGASSQVENWAESTQAMQIDGIGCLVRVTTLQGNLTTEAIAFVPGVKIVVREHDGIRILVPLTPR